MLTANAQISSGTYFLYNRNSGLALDANAGGTANGTPLIQWGYNGGNNQRWNVTSLGNGQYSIAGVASGRAVDIAGGSAANNAACLLWDYYGGNNQRITLQDRGSGFYSPVFAHSGKAMNVTGSSTAGGARIVQWDNDGGGNSQWRFQPVSLAAYPQASSGWYDKYLGNVNATKGRHYNLLFDGDSITDFWMGTGLSVWNGNYAPKIAYSFGISADRVENLWWRLLQGQSDGLDPKLVVLLIGTNNTGTDDAPTIASKITAVVNDYLTRCPNAHILLMGLFPRGQAPGTSIRNKIIDINNRISSLNGTGGGRVIYRDIGSRFLQTDGTLSATLMPDFLHPSAAGYQVWADNIRPIINQYVP
ncbi:MAG: RICIN domain-containing protein [Verrucomicrobiota bacterium]